MKLDISNSDSAFNTSHATHHIKTNAGYQGSFSTYLKEGKVAVIMTIDTGDATIRVRLDEARLAAVLTAAHQATAACSDLHRRLDYLNSNHQTAE